MVFQFSIFDIFNLFLVKIVFQFEIESVLNQQIVVCGIW